jgi:hypothetical protein
MKPIWGIVGIEYSAAFDTECTLPRSEIYGFSGFAQVVRFPDGSTDDLPDVQEITYLLLMMQSAEASKEGFEHLCSQVCEAAGGKEVVIPTFSPLKDLGRVTKKAADKYSSRYNKVLDVLRMMFVCTDVSGVYAVLVCLAKTKGLKIVRIKNRMDCRGTVLSTGFATSKVPAYMTRITCHLTDLKLSGCVGLDNTRLDAVLTGAVCEQLGATLKTLEARDVGFTGTIPKKLWKCLVKLDVLYLSSNKLEGRALPELAEDFGCMKSLRIVTVGNNKLLTGHIPTWIGQCALLAELHMAVNQIGGSMPAEIADCPKLEILNVGMNQITGSIPKALGRCSNLQKLFMNENRITGTIPAELGNCSQLKMLFLCDNEGLNGPIPDELGQCRQLTDVNLHGTKLTHCPDTLLQCVGIINKITPPACKWAMQQSARIECEGWQERRKLSDLAGCGLTKTKIRRWWWW